METIMIVDDEPELQRLYSAELADEGYRVLQASNGKEALRIAQEHSPDAVVLDVCMPEMDGIEALGKFVSRFRNIPVILNTAFSHYQDDYRSWPAEAFLTKSADLRPLKDALSRILRNHA